MVCLMKEMHPEKFCEFRIFSSLSQIVLFLFKTEGWIQTFICQPSWFKNNSVYGRPPGGSVRLAIKSRTAANIVHSPATEKNGH